MDYLNNEDARFSDVEVLITKIIDTKADKEEPSEMSGDELLDWFVGAQDKNPPSLHHPRICIFAKADDVARDLKTITDGTSPLNDFSKHIDSDLRVFELSNKENGEFTEKDIVMAMTYGMMSVSDGIDAMVLYGLEAKDEDVFNLEEDLTIADRLASLKDKSHDRMAALIGNILACRMSNTPVLLNGILALSAASFLNKIDPYLTSHCIYTGVVKCDQKALLKQTDILVLENEGEEMIAQTALSLIAYWQSILYEDRQAV